MNGSDTKYPFGFTGPVEVAIGVPGSDDETNDRQWRPVGRVVRAELSTARPVDRDLPGLSDLSAAVARGTVGGVLLSIPVDLSAMYAAFDRAGQSVIDAGEAFARQVRATPQRVMISIETALEEGRRALVRFNNALLVLGLGKRQTARLRAVRRVSRRNQRNAAKRRDVRGNLRRRSHREK